MRMTSNDQGHSMAQMVHQWEAERPDLDLTAFRLVGVVMQLAQIFEAEFRILAQAKFGIGAGDLRILLALRRAGEPYALRPTDLFQSLLVSSGAVTKQVERLVESGLVKRVLPKGAQRRRVIALTQKGVRAADFAQESISNSLAGIAPTLKTLQPSKVQTTLRCLDSLLAVAAAHASTTEGAGAAIDA